MVTKSHIVLLIQRIGTERSKVAKLTQLHFLLKGINDWQHNDLLADPSLDYVQLLSLFGLDNLRERKTLLPQVFYLIMKEFEKPEHRELAWSWCQNIRASD